jgi:hypothetical protein
VPELRLDERLLVVVDFASRAERPAVAGRSLLWRSKRVARSRRHECCPRFGRSTLPRRARGTKLPKLQCCWGARRERVPDAVAALAKRFEVVTTD